MAKGDRPVVRQIGENIRRLRIEAGMSQEQFAKLFGVTQASISWIEKGQRDAGTDFVFHVADEFKVPVSTILPLERSSIDTDIAVAVSELVRMKPEWKNALVQLPHLSDQQASVVISMIETLSKDKKADE